jgi:hypothetical protein
MAVPIHYVGTETGVPEWQAWRCDHTSNTKPTIPKALCRPAASLKASPPLSSRPVSTKAHKWQSALECKESWGRTSETGAICNTEARRLVTVAGRVVEAYIVSS